ncbi:MAG: hypothetical protein GY950_00610, partial [bacterium]|nr:hypothetical protein [bacterium]
MKILFFTDTLRDGGKERQLVQLLKGLSNEKDFTCEIVLMKRDIHFKEVFQLGMPIHVLNSAGKTNMRSDLYKLCKRSRPDIIHTWNLKTSLLSIFPAKFTGTKLLNGSVRNAIPNTQGFGKFRLLSRLSYAFSDAIVANSTTGLKNQGYTRPKGVCIHNGFDMSRVARLEAAAAVRRRFGLKTMYVVGMVGSFVDAKDYKTFIAAADIVTAQRNDVTFVAVGDGPELKRHKK